MWNAIWRLTVKDPGPVTMSRLKVKGPGPMTMILRKERSGAFSISYLSEMKHECILLDMRVPSHHMLQYHASGRYHNMID